MHFLQKRRVFRSRNRTKNEKVEVNVIETLEKVIDVPVVKQVEVPQAWPSPRGPM